MPGFSLNPVDYLRRSPAPPGFGKDKIVPEGESSVLSRLFFSWLSPLLFVGASRPLQKDDMWTLPSNRHTHVLTDLIEEQFYRRVPNEQRPKHYQETDLEHSASLTHEKGEDIEKATVEEGDVKGEDVAAVKNGTSKGVKGKKKKYSKRPLLSAVHSAFFWRWWTAGFLLLCSNTLRTTTPLITRVLLTWLTKAFAFAKSGGETEKPQGIGYGIGVAFALFAMQEVASLMQNHFFMVTMINGLSVRSGLIGAIFRKSLRLSARARSKHNVGQITTMISADATRLDLVSQYWHNLWIAPIELIIGIALLINNLGVSALVGLGVLLLGAPLQAILIRIMFRARFGGVKITDRRVRLTTEVLQGIRLIKFYAWESFYAHQIATLREKEIRKTGVLAVSRAGLIVIVTVVPIFASVLSFITYALLGHPLNPAIIFSSLQFFNIIRQPLTFFPLILSSSTDAAVALQRIGAFLTAEELEEPYAVDDDPANKWAVRMKGTFEWDKVEKVEAGKFAGAGGKGKHGKEAKGGAGPKGGEKFASKAENTDEGKGKGWRGWLWKGPAKSSLLPAPVTASETETPAGNSSRSSTTADGATIITNELEAKKDTDDKPFALENIDLKIPKGAFVAIVGRVGSGKSSLLQSLVGEMRKADGEVVFGGSVSYVPQAPWIMNATLRENVLFGQPDDEKRFNEIVEACSLRHDIEMLPDGEETEIGEKGINLSGGQKARVSLARAAYSDADVALLDDPLSAVDAHVGKAILERCLLSGPLAGKTRVLVTHALHVLARTDYIYVMENGKITERGTYSELISNGHAFAKLVEEYGAQAEEEERKEGEELQVQKSSPEAGQKISGAEPLKEKKALMSEEERETGSVPLSTYAAYFGFAGGAYWILIILFLLTLNQGASVGNNLFLGFWTAESIHGFSEGDYIAVYTGLGVAQGIFMFILSFTFNIIGLIASLRLFKSALSGVLHSPISFFDTTPMGRILSRLSKDQDTLDTQLAMSGYTFLSTFSNVLGTVALVFYTFPYLGIIFVPLTFLYYIVSSFYRRSSVETKRLDSLMRSALYASYTETLTGLATVRAYREQNRFVTTAEKGLDLENRAYFLTISIQRWLSVRLDIFGNILILGIALFAVGFRNTVNPSKVGVVLSYSLTITQIFTMMVDQYAQTEQSMNAVERVLVYADLPAEGLSSSSKEPSPSWPEKGEVKFKDVELSYREGLPLVLKGVSFNVKPAEKIGIVGRTGAGKSSLLQALFRIVELQNGAIEIDDINIHDLQLETLRQRLALVPQDSTLFLGTLRENLDPQNTRTDAEIISALRRTWLLPHDGTPADPAVEVKFSLDSAVGDEGSNFSAGEKQLLAMCRALIKGSRIIVLDEATSSVDVETDAKIQRTIKSEFMDRTLLCIAHRLNTIVYYDRILVMDAGAVAEFDTPINLFDRKDSIFRSLCDEAGLTREDILRIRGEPPT